MIWLLMLTLTLLGNPDTTPATEAVDPPAIVPPSRTMIAEALLASEFRRIRTLDRRVNQLIVEGVRRSRTFADLVAAVHDTNVIVYVETVFNLPPATAGRLLLHAVNGNDRYLRVQLRGALEGDRSIAVLAHELRHALEVAADASVVDDAGMVALYRRIGHVSHETDGFDTDAANLAGRTVLDELRTARPSRSPRGA